MKTIIMLNNRTNVIHEFEIKKFIDVFRKEIQIVEEAMIYSHPVIFIAEENEDGIFSNPPLKLVLEHWNSFSPEYSSPRGVVKEWELIDNNNIVDRSIIKEY